MLLIGKVISSKLTHNLKLIITHMQVDNLNAQSAKIQHGDTPLTIDRYSTKDLSLRSTTQNVVKTKHSTSSSHHGVLLIRIIPSFSPKLPLEKHIWVPLKAHRWQIAHSQHDLVSPAASDRCIEAQETF